MFKWFTRRYTKTRNHNSICDSLNNTILNLFCQNQKLKEQVQKQKEEIEELTLRLKNQNLQKFQSYQDLPLQITDLN